MQAEKSKNNKKCCSVSCGCKPVRDNSMEDYILEKYNGREKWITVLVNTPSGTVQQVATVLNREDILGSWMARWGIKRMDYKVRAGLYCVGLPDQDSPVLVTANYKMSFDALRKELVGLSAWILVLDTKGINVWCAAGKGTFGTAELIDRINKVGLSAAVSHRRIILPQLGAPGVSAHEILKQTGFKVVYGPVRAADIKSFISAGYKATNEMRTVKFNFIDRLVLTPMELIPALKNALALFGVLFLINLVVKNPFGITDFYSYIGAIFAGGFITPILLPFIPGRAFAVKGGFVGLIWAVFVIYINGFPVNMNFGIIKAAAYLLILPAVSSFCAMNFTGASTYTSLSGVLREMRTAVPVIIGAAGIGIILLLTNSFIIL